MHTATSGRQEEGSGHPFLCVCRVGAWGPRHQPVQRSSDTFCLRKHQTPQTEGSVLRDSPFRHHNSDANPKFQLLPVPLSSRLKMGDPNDPATPPPEQLTELRGPRYFLEHQLMTKGHNSPASEKRRVGKATRRGASVCTLSQRPSVHQPRSSPTPDLSGFKAASSHRCD